VVLYAGDFGVIQTAIVRMVAIHRLAHFLMNYPSGQLADRLELARCVQCAGNPYSPFEN